ncbi:MAG: c-type cytochrome [Luteibacter jiangsuensis]
MTDQRKPWWRDRIVGGSLATLALLLLLSGAIGFIWLPSAQNDARFKGILDAICGAAGIPRGWLADAVPPLPTPRHVSTVVLTPDTLSHDAPGSVGRGGTIALKCTMCHGLRGVSTSETPSLAGQQSAAIYKQLRDYQTGARASAVMEPLVKDLSDQDLKDLAMFYGSLPREPARDLGNAPDIVAFGSPTRNIAACGSCHGGMTSKLGAPWLDAQPRAYLRTQLLAFSHGTRRNDTSAQMRNVAANMTPQEIEQAVEYYGSGR